MEPLPLTLHKTKDTENMVARCTRSETACEGLKWLS